MVQRLYERSNDYDIVCGDLRIENPEKAYYKIIPEKLLFSFFLENTLPHQSTFVKRELFAKIGLYNENFKSTSDWEFFMKAVCKYNSTYKYVSIPFASYNTDGISSQKDNWIWIREDKRTVLERDYSAFLDDYAKLRRLEETEKKLRNIENSKFWKFRNRIVYSRFGKLFFRHKQ